MRHKRCLIIIMLGFLIPITLTECPRLCECKWKSGKESVLCINANMTVVPERLDISTQILDLTGNNLSFIRNEEFSKAGLVNIQKLYLAKCRLRSIDRYAFNNLINLVELDLSLNFFSSVPSHVFESTPELRDLKLSSNPIHRIPNDAFVNTPQLIRLEISNCKINSIESRAFYGLEKSLEWLKLDRNRLSHVMTSSFTIFQNLHGLELSGNPWNCSCSLRPFREWMIEKNVPYDIPPACAYPKRLFERSWDKLDLDDFACIPEIFAYESKTYGFEGKNVTMTCRVNSVPKPSVKWLMKNKVIANFTGSTFVNKKNYLMHLTNDSSKLTIFSAELQDTGTYFCTAENKAGKSEAAVTLAISKYSEDNNLTKKVLVVSILVGVVLTLVICAIGVCFCRADKRFFVVWKTKDVCGREDNYEKIELSQKFNGGVKNREDTNSLTPSFKKNGDYRVVPGNETDHDEEDESTLEVTTPSTSASRKATLDDSKHRIHTKDAITTVLKNEECQSSRDNIRRTHSSTFGTSKATPSISPTNPFYSNLRYCQTTESSTNLISPNISTGQTDPERYNTSSLKIISTSYHPNEHSYFTTVVNNSNKIPDILNIYGNLTSNTTANRNSSQSENGSYQNLNEIFCTLPRKKNVCKYMSSESQTALLLDSRYNSSGGESGSSFLSSGVRRMSVECQRQDIGILNNRVNRLSGSFLNLESEDRTKDVCSTPLLDINSLENRLMYKGNSLTSKFTNSTKPPNPYDYHAAQLERFLEEYRVLQKQLTEMKETCDSIVQAKSAKNDVSPSLSNEVCDTPNSTKSLKETIDHNIKYDGEVSNYLLAKSSSSRNINSRTIHNS